METKSTISMVTIRLDKSTTLSATIQQNITTTATKEKSCSTNLVPPTKNKRKILLHQSCFATNTQYPKSHNWYKNNKNSKDNNNHDNNQQLLRITINYLTKSWSNICYNNVPKTMTNIQQLIITTTNLHVQYHQQSTIPNSYRYTNAY